MTDIETGAPEAQSADQPQPKAGVGKMLGPIVLVVLVAVGLFYPFHANGPDNPSFTVASVHVTPAAAQTTVTAVFDYHPPSLWNTIVGPMGPAWKPAILNQGNERMPDGSFKGKQSPVTPSALRKLKWLRYEVSYELPGNVQPGTIGAIAQNVDSGGQPVQLAIPVDNATASPGSPL